jgi:hypothetical protein
MVSCMKFLTTLIILISCVRTSQAQNLESKPKPDMDFVKFFEGAWVGSGQFSNGKKIGADASFRLSLDSCWLIYTHTDRSPNRYKAISVWGIDKSTAKFVDYVFDNFHGHRLFTSDGWNSAGLILTCKEITPANETLFQRFTYLKIDADKFKMSYEVSNDGTTWKLGDSLVFVKQAN